MDEVARIRRILRDHEITSFNADPPLDFPGIGLSMRATAAQRFLEALVPALDRDDELWVRMVGRPQDLTVDQEPWKWVAALQDGDERLQSFGAAALELRITVCIPYDDLGEVVARLERWSAGSDE